jgi:hypothetical protein
MSFGRWNKYGVVIGGCVLLNICCDPAEVAQAADDCRAGTTESRLECLAKRIDELQDQKPPTHIQSADPRLQGKCIVVLDHQIAGTDPLFPLVVDTCKSGDEGFQAWRLTGQ